VNEVPAVELLGWARRAISDPGHGWGRSWGRISAFLTRTALERALRDFWTGPLTPMGWAPISTQLLCLLTYKPSPHLPPGLYDTWMQLSRACHAHPYELAPTVGELERWISVVESFVGARAPREEVTL
jgi:hypothetical protein